MTLSRIFRAGGITIAIAFIALGTIFWGNQRLAQADIPPNFASQIICLVFTELNESGSPIPFLKSQGCPPDSTPVAECKDTIDNDGDNLIDAADPACHTDGDAGNPDSYDPDLNDESLHIPECRDGLDNDSDGLTDTNDPGCHTDFDPSNSASYTPNGDDESRTPQCSDGIDNDNDGLSDDLDPGCANPSDDEEEDAAPACNDGVDNDSDGQTDFPNDPGCTDENDDDETNTGGGGGGGGGGVENTLPLCSDGIDNDSDGLIDLLDPDCAGFKPSILVIKLVDNTNGGTATSSDFTIHVTASSSSHSFSGNATGTLLTLNPGAFEVHESGGPSGYILATSTDCTGTLVTGDEKTCTLTNMFSTTTADVSLTKEGDVDAPTPGSTVIFTLTATNAGPNTAENVVVTDLLPSGLTYVSDNATTTGTTYATTTGAWTIGTLLNGSSTALQLVATVNNGTEGQTIENVATIESDQPDSNTGDNTDEKTITVPTPSACSDGVDNDTDGQTDFPNDTGCSSADDNDETNFGGGGSSSTSGGGGGGGGGSAIATQINPTLGGQVTQPQPPGQVLGTATGGPAPSCDTYLTDFLRIGRANNPDQVRRLQVFLNEEMGSNLPVTGFFGSLTDAAVRAFQSKYAADILTPWGITEPTGYVYLTTRKKINELNCARPFPLTPSEQNIIDSSRAGIGSGTSGASTPSPSSPPLTGTGGPDPEEEENQGTSTDAETGTSTATSGILGDNNQFVAAALLILLLLALGGGWYYWQSRQASANAPPLKT